MLYDAEFVHNLLPQKAPFAFVDEILELQKGDPESPDESLRMPKIKAVWHLSGEEKFFGGHFPGNPVLPGVLQVESMAQAATIMTQIARPEVVEGKRPAFIGVDNCRFRAAVIPPADLTLIVEMTMARRTLFKCHGKIMQGETLVCEADFSAAMVK